MLSGSFATIISKNNKNKKNRIAEITTNWTFVTGTELQCKVFNFMACYCYKFEDNTQSSLIFSSDFCFQFSGNRQSNYNVWIDDHGSQTSGTIISKYLTLSKNIRRNIDFFYWYCIELHFATSVFIKTGKHPTDKTTDHRNEILCFKTNRLW